jgi:hypothetical protein
MNICDICRAIPFHELPSEDEPGLPHQSSFQDLKVSADDCALCSLILTAANQSREHINDMYTESEIGEWQEFNSTGRELPSGRSVSVVTILGAWVHGGAVGVARTKGARSTQNKPGFPFKDDNSVRPWLYGNWWASDTNPSVASQLIGLGVRLGTGPEIEAAEGNTEDEVWCRGSQLRLRTDDGMFGWPS